MEDPQVMAETEILTYANIARFKDRQRFWLYHTEKNLFIFDRHVSDVYPIEDELKDLILAGDAAAFEKILAGMPDENYKANHTFVEQILNLADEPVASKHSKTKIATLKLNTSTRCNLNCRYCFRDKAGEHELPDKTLIFKAIDYLVYDCGQDLNNYTIGLNLAAEPLLHPELLEEIFAYLKRIRSKTGKNLEIFFITNGTVLNDKILKLIKKIRKERSLSISIDGPREVHDANRVHKNGEGSYAEIIANLELLRKKKLPYAAEAVLSKINPYPLAILRHLLELGFASVNIKPIRNGTPCSLDTASLADVKKGYDDYFAYIEEELTRRKTRILSVLIKDYALRPFWRILFNQKMNARCNWGIDTISMDHKGDFYPCDSVMGFAEYCVGNVTEGIAWDKFHRDLNCELRGNCQSCWARNICAGTCPVNSIVQQQDILAIDPVECELNKYLVEKNLVLICNLIDKGINMRLLKDILGYNLYHAYLLK
jgi:uncharacterized protein